jgi:phosphoenolpyruvate carboxykinase (ATP)
MKVHHAEAWLVNTGWMGGAYGSGTRIDLPSTRHIINAILNGTISNSEFKTLPIFNLSIPTTVDGVDDRILDPSAAWESTAKWRIAATDLAIKFNNNFSKFTGNKHIEKLVEFGPKI